MQSWALLPPGLIVLGLAVVRAKQGTWRDLIWIIVASLSFAGMLWPEASGLYRASLRVHHAGHWFQPPICTVGQPIAMEPPWDVLSPMRAAGLPPISTVAEPLMIESGGPTHTQLSPRTAAGKPPSKTVGHPGPAIGPPTWGMGGTAGVCIGQVCRSARRAAAGMVGGAERIAAVCILKQALARPGRFTPPACPLSLALAVLAVLRSPPISPCWACIYGHGRHGRFPPD